MHARVFAPIVTIALVVLGCTTNPTPNATPQATSPSPAGFKNLRVLPHDITRDQLLATMRTFTRSLGVKCNFCHVVTATEPKEELDFPSDAKEEKRIARVMIQMTQQINGAWMDRVEQAEGPKNAAAAAPGGPDEPRVGCWTCHRGHSEPEMMPPPPPRQ